MLIKNNITHAASYNAEIIGKTLRERFKIDVNKYLKFITSDTSLAAWALMDKFDYMQQIDCETHVVNLAIAYSVGLK